MVEARRERSAAWRKANARIGDLDTRLLTMYRQGYTYHAMARELDIRIWSIRRWLDAARKEQEAE